MDLYASEFGEKSRLRVLLDHFSVIDDPRASHKVAFPLAEILLLVVCGTIADCDDYDAIGLWGAGHLEFLRRFLPYYHGVPCGRWLTIMMNRINPALFGRHRWQDTAAQSRSPRGPSAAPSRLGLRHDQPPGAWARSRFR